MQLYILLDTSGSMEGAKIGALNDAMSNILVTLQEAAFNGGKIELAIMTIGKTAQWMYDSPKPVMDFGWKELQANGMTPLGLACENLDSALNKYSVAGESVGIILLSDGCPTDDYDSGLALLDQNNIFEIAGKYAIALGENADIPSLKRFVKDDSHLFFVSTVDDLLDTLSSTINKEIDGERKTRKVINSQSDDEWD
jgi:uncharacterized protein YegL